jgi:hypothetical protein
MRNHSTRIPAYLLAILFILGWFALVSQFWLILENRQTSVAGTIARYFSFFTILTNLLLAVCTTVLLIRPAGRWGNFFSSQTVLTALTVYITIVGITYNTILRFLWQPQGLQWITDELLHLVIPVVFILIWCLYVAKDQLQYKHAFTWLLYPLAYIIYTAVRGAITDLYPYPFVNVTVLGYSRVIVNSLVLVAAFMGLSLFLIAVGKYLSRSKKSG